MDKLKALRSFLEERSLSALLIPYTDEFQNEYLPPQFKRLKWLTGFTGSAGFAIVTQDKAAFFTDGRYVLQAKQEVHSCFEQYNISHKTPLQWIEENLSPNATIGYDPWLFTEVQLEKFHRPLVPLIPNPIDQLWDDRPLPCHNFIRLHPLEYAGESDESKRKRIASILKADHLLLTACDSIAWLLNIRGLDVTETPLVHSVCLLNKDGSYVLFIEPQKVNAELLEYFRKNSGAVVDISKLSDHLKTLKGSCQFDPHTTAALFAQTLQQSGIEIVRHVDPCALPKAVKNSVELEGARKSHIEDGIALCRFFAWLETQPLKGETTECSAADKLYAFRQEGRLFQGPSFPTISAFNAHGAIIHYIAKPETDTPLKREGLYLLDSGGQYLTGTTDVTRTIALGVPTPEQKDRYTRVLKGHIALATTSFPNGTAGAQLDSLARRFLWEVGCDFEHGTGHGVGSYLGVHEGPQAISKRFSPTPLQPGMILSNEPGCYKEGEYGIRIESLITVIEHPILKDYYTFETLTLAPLDLNLIEESLLTPQEQQWIRDYHEKVLQRLSPHLDEDTLRWLQKAIYFPK